MLTAYTARTAQLLDPHCDVQLVGDSLAQVIYGLPSTLPATFAELGADVIKVESPAPLHGPRMTCWYGLDVDQGKRLVPIDLKAGGGPAVLARLARGACRRRSWRQGPESTPGPCFLKSDCRLIRSGAAEDGSRRSSARQAVSTLTISHLGQGVEYDGVCITARRSES